MKLTKLGKNLLAEVVANGVELHFTRIAIGSGDYDGKVHALTSLVNWEMDLPIVDTKVIGNGTAAITAYLSNAEVVKGFKCKEHGVFALDSTGAEILFAYRNVGEEDYDFIPAAGNVCKNIMLSYEVEIADATNVTASIDMSVAYVSTADFKAHVDSEHPHLNIPNHYSDVDSTSAIWATDHDDHLHKLSIDALRKQLRDKPAINADIDTEQLGLNANLLFIEDFTTDDATDYFKVQVTSSAENGDLIGVADIKNLKTGAVYLIADAANAELVTIQSIKKNNSGYYAKLVNPLAHAYHNAKLYRTLPVTCQNHSLKWSADTFAGVHANITRAVDLNFDAATLQGNAFIDDNYFTMG